MAHCSVPRLAGYALAACLAAPSTSAAQAQPPAPPAAAATPAADQPSIKVGVQIFADYTVQDKPKIKDANGNEVTLNSFNIGRSYINVTGNISKNISFRLTPDIARETGVGSSLNGSYTFRLKFAYAQWNVERLGKASYARFGLQAVPWLEFIDAIYRYRFQSGTFLDREGILPFTDAGASFHYALPGDYGDVQAGVFNGEGFTQPEVNNQKSIQLRGTLRPLPHRGALHGLRVTGSWDNDAYVKNADRKRAIAGVTFEHPHVNTAFEYLSATGLTAATAAVDSRGWSAWVTPKITHGWEGLLRFDQLQPDKTKSGQKKKRTIAGVAYWFPRQSGVTTALMFDVDNTVFDGFAVPQATQRKIGVHALINY